jgi:putative PEP-CTERM system histidine kinase
MSLEAFSFATASFAATCLAITLLVKREAGRERGLLTAALLLTAIWAGAVAVQSFTGRFLLVAHALEVVRGFIWIVFLLALLRTALPQGRFGREFPLVLGVIGAFSTVFVLLALLRDVVDARFPPYADIPLLAAYLLLAVGGLVAVEQVYRNTPSWHRRAVKYLCIGTGGMFAYDFYLYADALLLNRVDSAIWNARGFAHALVIPLIGVAIGRSLPWSLADKSNTVLLSRRVVLHTTSLAAAGLYLLFMGAGGYYVRTYGGQWGTVAQLTFLFGAVLVLAVLLFSGQLRARMNVFVSKHFFRYKYDYREEWLRFTRTLSSGVDGERPHERVIRAIAQILAAPAGVLWLRNDQDRFSSVAHWNWPSEGKSLVTEPADSPLTSLLEEREWVINLDEHGAGARIGRSVNPANLPDWLHATTNAWLVVPLVLHQKLLGFVVLARSPINAVNRHFNWEDCDLLKTAGRGAASYLAEVESSRALAEARQFEAFNRLSAFVMHDIKGLVTQLSLVVTNASRHKHNPEFLEDAIGTIENSIEKMNRLLTHLSNNHTCCATEQVDLVAMTTQAVKDHLPGQRPKTVFECAESELSICADRDRLAAVIGHVLQNSRDATPPEGRIHVRVRTNGSDAVIEVEDNGCGMDEHFVRERLFRPFSSTKQAGMGIGMYETREFIRSLGGRVEVNSRVGHGTVVRLHLPLKPNANRPTVYRQSQTASRRWPPKSQSSS